MGKSDPCNKAHLHEVEEEHCVLIIVSRSLSALHGGARRRRGFSPELPFATWSLPNPGWRGCCLLPVFLVSSTQLVNFPRSEQNSDCDLVFGSDSDCGTNFCPNPSKTRCDSCCNLRFAQIATIIVLLGICVLLGAVISAIRTKRKNQGCRNPRNAKKKSAK